MRKITVLMMILVIGLPLISGCETLKKALGLNQEEEKQEEEINQHPNTPGNPSPSNGATDQSINVDLSWTGGDPDTGDTVTYDVYFEAADSSPDILVSNDQTGTTYDPGTLDRATHYYWRIIAADNHASSTEGPVWDFITTSSYYTDNGDGTITDSGTGLMWVKDGNSPGCNNRERLKWEDALAFGENLNYAGYRDWRLPSRQELQTIVDNTTSNPAINTTYFPNTEPYWYWSSTTRGPDTAYAGCVNFFDGTAGNTFKHTSYYVRPVRGAQ